MTNSNDMPLAAKPIDRAAQHRGDESWLETAMKRDDVLVCVVRKGEPLMQGEGLYWMGPEAAALPVLGSPLFLGQDKQGAPIFAIAVPPDFEAQSDPLTKPARFEEVRGAFGKLSPLEANCASTARSLFLWHYSHGFCAKCGGQNAMIEAGWKAQCQACGTEHFPRTDPVAIMMAVKDDKCLLGRGPGWPEGFMSCLAGFCEPGETIEQAAAREIFEEAGIVADPASAEYVACQPWPFPSSLMVGLILQAETDEINIDPKEIEDARWVSRDEAKLMMDGKHPDLYCPPEMAIAHHIIKHWVEQG